MNHPNRKVMQQAIDIMKENKVVAAVIVKGDEVIATGFNSVREDIDPTHHAEIKAIVNATKKLGIHRLEGCWIYNTFEQCPMCASACIWARMEGIVYGANMKDVNEKYTQRVLVPCEEIIKHGTRN